MPAQILTGAGYALPTEVSLSSRDIGLRITHFDAFSNQHAQRLAQLCKALGHPARITIVDALRQIDGCVCGALVEMLPLAQSTVSQHLKILKQAGVVKGEIEGPRTCYCLNGAVLDEFRLLVGSLLDANIVEQGAKDKEL